MISSYRVQTVEGAERVATIVLELKNFFRLDSQQPRSAALERCMESALTICSIAVASPE